MIQDYENLLRKIISNELGIEDNADYKVSADRIIKWKEKRDEESKKFDGVLIEPRLIYYSDFYDLSTIISKNWDRFKAFFDDKKRFNVLFAEIETFRNTISHGRQLLPYQEQLLNGIIGDLKTRIILHHNKNMKAEDYFIKLLKISDNLGNVWDETMESIGIVTKSTLRVDDTLELIIDAFDPKGREITYEIEWGNFRQESATNIFRITINNSMVSKQSLLRLRVFTKGEEYGNIDRTSFLYVVLP